MHSSEKTHMTAEALREYRTTSGLTQVGLASLLGVTPRAVQHWELGTRKVPQWVPRLLAQLGT